MSMNLELFVQYLFAEAQSFYGSAHNSYVTIYNALVCHVIYCVYAWIYISYRGEWTEDKFLCSVTEKKTDARTIFPQSICR